MTDELDKPQDENNPKTYTQEEVNKLIEDSVGGLKSKVDELLGEKKAEAEKRRQAEEEAKLKAEEAARKNGDLESIENSWREKLTAKEAEYSERLRIAEKRNYELTVGRQAVELASRLVKPNAQRLLVRDIQERLTLDEQGNLRVLDLQGKPSALTIAELESEIRNDPTYADIIIVSNSTGSGATGGGFGGGATKNPKDMTNQEKAEWLTKDPAGFEKAAMQGAFK